MIRNTLVASILGAIFVAVPLMFSFTAIILWAVLLIVTYRKELRRGNRKRAAMAVALQTSVMILIVTAAVVAPGKRVDRFLDYVITIPKCRMTLAEIERDEHGSMPYWRPLIVGIVVPEEEKATVIEFPGRTLTLRQFVVAIEQRSTLRRRLHGCGNESTILWGTDCWCLHLSRPKR